jgi:hypothetical protein
MERERYAGTGEASRPETEDVPEDGTTDRKVSHEVVAAREPEEDIAADPQFLAIAMAGKVVVDCVGLDVVVIRTGDAAEYSRFSLGHPSL